MNLAREPGFRLGSLDVRPATREVVHAAGRDVLEPRVMCVLVALVRARGEVVTRDDLSAACWEGRVVSDDAINRVLSRIRKLSELTGGRDFTLETITKVGYRLVASKPSVEPAPVAAARDEPERPAGGLPWRRAWLVAAAVVVAALAGIGVWRLTAPQPQWMQDPRASLTLAVLPFDNLGAAEADDMLALGMAREIRNTLSRVRGLRVVSDSSSFALAEPLTAAETGKRLMADLLLDGSLERSGDTLKLSVELVDGWDGVNIWTGVRSGAAGDLDKLRQQMAAAVFEQIVIRIGPNRLEQLAQPAPPDPRTYRQLMEARELIERATGLRLRGRGKESLVLGERANTLVDDVLAVEPNSPMALLQKARIVAMAATPQLLAANASLIEKQANAAEYLRKALAADPDYAPALGALGEYYRRFEWRWSAAQSMLERSLALDPNQADVRLSYSYFLSGVGRCVEAVEQAKAAVALDPEFGWRTLGVPRALKCAGRAEEANAAYLDALRQDPGNLVILRELYLNHLMRRDVKGLEDLRVYLNDTLWKETKPEIAEGWDPWTQRAIAALRGEPGEFIAMIEDAARRDAGNEQSLPLSRQVGGKGDLMWIMAVEYAFTGHTEQAIAMLQGAVAAGTLYIPETMPYGAHEFTAEMRANPLYQAIWRNDPRLVELAALRRQAVEQRQMEGVLPSGERVSPAKVVDSRS